MSNVSVNMGYYANDLETHRIVSHYVSVKHRDQPYPKYPKGFIAAEDCELQSNRWIASAFPGWNIDWTLNGVERIHSSSQHSSQYASSECSQWVEHPVLVMERDTFANFFHDSEDFMNAFLTMAVLKWNVGSTQIYLADLYPEGPFW